MSKIDIENKIPTEAIRLIEMFNKSGYEAYFVGGCVRDLLLKEKPHDFDICTNAHPDKIKQILEVRTMTLTNEELQDILAGLSEEEQKALSNVYTVLLNN